MGTEAAVEILGHLRQYPSQLYEGFDAGTIGETRLDDVVEITTLGRQTRLSEPLLAAPVIRESDYE